MHHRDSSRVRLAILVLALLSGLVALDGAAAGAVAPAPTNLLDCKYGPGQVGTPASYSFTGTLGVNLLLTTGAIGPAKQTANPPTSDLGPEQFENGDYFQFFPSTTVAGSFGLKLFDVNGGVKRVVHQTGFVAASGPDFVLYLGDGNEQTVLADFNLLPGGVTIDADATPSSDAEAGAYSTCRTVPLTRATLMAYHPLAPSRAYDSRNAAPLAANVERAVTIAGVGEVPADAGAAMLNVTVTNAVADGWVRIGPCGWHDGGTSTVNFLAGQNIANATMATLGNGGAVCATATTTIDLIFDVAGYGTTTFPATGTSKYRPLPPTRLADTRVAGTALAAGGVLTVPLQGVARVPTDLNDTLAAAMTVTVTQPVDGGFITVYPCGTDRPDTSNVNFGPQQSIANTAISALGAADEVCVYTSTATHVIVDLTGIFAYSALALFDATPPTRLADTRDGGTVLPAGGVLEVATDSLPATFNTLYGAVINLTVTQPTDGGYLTAYPCGGTRPWASSINFQAGQTVASMAMARVGTGAKICVYAAAPAHVIVDVTAAVTVDPESLVCLGPEDLALLRAAADDYWLKAGC